MLARPADKAGIGTPRNAGGRAETGPPERGFRGADPRLCREAADPLSRP